MTALPSPQDIAPVDPDEFIAAYEYAVFVADYEFVEEIPAIGESIVMTDIGQLKLNNVFDNRFGLAAARYFNAGQKFLDFMWRAFALRQILRHPSMKEYKRQRSDHSQVHCAVFEVAATEKLSDKYEFEPEAFFQKVRDVAARMNGEQANELKRSRDGDKRSSKKRQTEIGED